MLQNALFQAQNVSRSMVAGAYGGTHSALPDSLAGFKRKGLEEEEGTGGNGEEGKMGIQRGPDGHAFQTPMTRVRLKKSCESCCRRWQ